MHTQHLMDDEYREWTIHHNGDWSGRVLIDMNTGDQDEVEQVTDTDGRRFWRVSIPFEVMKEIVGRALQDREIDRLEDEVGRRFLDRLTGHEPDTMTGRDTL